MSNLPFIGLCAGCQHVKPVRSAKGSLFVLCGYANTDPRFPKYPPLPVLVCPAFQPHPPPAEADSAESQTA